MDLAGDQVACSVQADLAVIQVVDSVVAQAEGLAEVGAVLAHTTEAAAGSNRAISLNLLHC